MELEGWKKQNPFALFDTWLAAAKTHASIREATAMSIATISQERGLSNRVVLLKSISPAGLTFFTNYLSHKGHDLAENPQVAAVFYWDPMERQVRISGRAKKTSREESERYWATRSRNSQLSQYISKQSEAVESRAELEKLVLAAEEKFKDKPVPCPAHWGGYLLEPIEFEFWQGQPGRLHDRYEFHRTNAQDSQWQARRLYP
jgi:pyridoxamine 5'-phosphate oxidase